MGDSDTRYTPTLISSYFSLPSPTLFVSSVTLDPPTSPLFCKVYADGNSSASITEGGELYTWGSGTAYRLMHQTSQVVGDGSNDERNIDMVQDDNIDNSNNDNNNNNNNNYNDIKDVLVSDDSHKYNPTCVDTFSGSAVHSFTFARTSSAVLVFTKLYKVKDLKKS